jgi:hypothetical protein
MNKPETSKKNEKKKILSIFLKNFYLSILMHSSAPLDFLVRRVVFHGLSASALKNFDPA